MEVTREMVVSRLDQMRAEKDQVWANYNAYLGAIQDLEHWLGVFDRDSVVNNDRLRAVFSQPKPAESSAPSDAGGEAGGG